MKKLLLITIVMFGFALSNVYSQQITNKAETKAAANDNQWVLNFNVSNVGAARITIPGHGTFGVNSSNNCIRIPASTNPLTIILNDHISTGHSGTLEVSPANPYTPVNIIHHGKEGIHNEYRVELRGYYWTENYVINITILPY